MQRARVLLADDHALFREGLAGILAAQPDMEVVGEARDGLEAVVKALELKPDLVLMDVQMPGLDGLEATRRIRQALPQTTVVVLTVRDDDDKLFQALKNGAQGYLLKDHPILPWLATQLQGIAQGQPPLSPAIARRLLRHFQAPRAPQAQAQEGLSQREREVLGLLAQGVRIADIGQVLGISRHTVGDHVKAIYRKLGISSRAEAALQARGMGLA